MGVHPLDLMGGPSLGFNGSSLLGAMGVHILGLGGALLGRERAPLWGPQKDPKILYYCWSNVFQMISVMGAMGEA